jgi:hypothetical protein
MARYEQVQGSKFAPLLGTKWFPTTFGNVPEYDKAVGLLPHLRTIAETRGTLAEFGRRLHEIRERHARKERFIERLAAIS